MLFNYRLKRQLKMLEFAEGLELSSKCACATFQHSKYNAFGIPLCSMYLNLSLI
jgi:hypothetical protein